MSYFFSCQERKNEKGNIKKLQEKIIEDVNAEKFHQLIEKEGGMIVDVRTSKEFNSAHITDATNIDFYSEDFLDKLNIVRKDVPIYVYCRSGGRSSSASNEMEKLGFTKVYNLLGGIGSWQSLGYEIVSSTEGKISKQPKITETQLNKILDNNKTVLLAFNTQWCVPCKKMKPIIEEIQKENLHVKIVFVDADINKSLVKKYQIDGIPVFIVFRDSEEYFRQIGITSKQELVNQL